MLSSSLHLKIVGGGLMLSSELGGVVGAGPEAGTEATPEARPRARNCWCRRLGRKGWPGIICILAVSLAPWARINV